MKDKQELLDIYQNETEFIGNFKVLFSLRTLFRESIFTERFKVDPRVTEYVVLTKQGMDLFIQLRGKLKDPQDCEIQFAIFLEFYNEDLLVDVTKSNIDAIQQVLSSSILEGNILFPWIWGKLLYDKYFDEFQETHTQLSIEEVEKLLSNTPKGVFQIGNMVVGPFGVTKSRVERYFPPTKQVHLWHCSDPSCSHFHSVDFIDADSVVGEISELIKELNTEPDSEWYAFFVDLIIPDSYYYDTDRLKGIQTLIVSVFSNSDLRVLITDIIENNPEIRNQLPKDKRLQGSASTISSTLDRAESFQLSLFEEETNTVKCIERLIERNAIYIPTTEVRTSHQMLTGGFYDIYHECSSLGVRSVSSQENLCVNRLLVTIEKTHPDLQSKDDLIWRLMEYKKGNFKETIENYVLHKDPLEIVKESLLYSPRQTSRVIDSMYGNFKTPTSEKEKNLLANKLLWKLGFTVNNYPDNVVDLFKKNRKFRDIALKYGEEFTETEKDEIRSASVNLFVSLEKILEESLSYITWTLLSDHYLKTKFSYNFEDARNVMCDKLNGYKIGSSDPLIFDNTGNNTLFPLVEGYAALNEMMKKYMADDASKYLRQESQIPHFHKNTELNIFPFLSSIFLFDIKAEQLEETKSAMMDLHRDFAKHNVLSVRNKLEHKERIKNNQILFPKKSEILAACDCIDRNVNMIVSKGLYPNVFLFKSSSRDGYNRKKYEFEDSQGNRVIVKPIPQFNGCHLPEYECPQIIAPIITVGNSSEPLRFRYQETSEYLRFWKDFPRKRGLAPIEDKE